MNPLSYSLYPLVSAVALKLGRPVDLVTVRTYRGRANEYEIRDGGTMSITFWYGMPPNTQTGAERCVFIPDTALDSDTLMSLDAAVEHITSQPWRRDIGL